MGILQFIKGPKIPDRNDPQYKDMHENYKKKGAEFADATGITWSVGRLQRFGEAHKKAFLIFVFVFVIFCFGLNMYRLVRGYNASHGNMNTKVEQIDKAMTKRIK